MDPSSNEMCVICHDDLVGDIYTLPECPHKYHTNCIVHWFRAGHNTCPLCNHQGINGVSDLHWGWRAAAMENYKKLRRKSRSKTASIELKKEITKIKRIEQKNKVLKKEWNEYINAIPTNPEGRTRRQLVNEYLKKRRKSTKWKRNRLLNEAKLCLGMKYFVPIIIATKVEM